MPHNILSIGFDFPGGEVETVPMDSAQSLLDADIIVFEPGLAVENGVESSYEGKPLLSDRASFQAKERVQHWQRELQACAQAGKLVVVFLVAPEAVFVKTGKTSVSGTGRNAQVTNIVARLSSYAALPFDLGLVVAATGAGIVPAGDLKYLATFWKEFGTTLRYEAYFDGKVTDVLLKTRSGDRVVGAGLRVGKGAVLLIPPLDLTDIALVTEDRKTGEQLWSKKACELGKRLSHSLSEISKALKSDMQTTPAPGWVSDERYRLSTETEIERAIQVQSTEIARLEAERKVHWALLAEAGSLRSLLFEKGPRLESAIIEALRILGFKAESFAKGDSEFDAVFTSAEGRFLGEAEGKDSHAVNVDKLRQLEMNIHEDLAREEIDLPAKGVLFGNAYRLQKLEERGDYFTSKCVKAAERSRTALVRTPDLFAVAQYLKENDDPACASACRVALFETEGQVVRFPSIPIRVQSAQAPVAMEPQKKAG